MKSSFEWVVIDSSNISERLPAPRLESSHKRSFGKLQIVAGSRKYPGAAKLCALGAFKAGCGYVHLETEAPEEILRDLPELIPGFDPNSNAFVVGPGLDPSPRELSHILRRIPPSKPLLLDGGALAHWDQLDLKDRECVVATPHEGEFAKILEASKTQGISWSAERIRSDRPGALLEFARHTLHVTLLLKGARSLVFSKSKIFEIHAGSVAMATAGQGDLLAGVLGAYLALGMSGEQASVVAAYLCGHAADELSTGADPQGVLAHEVASRIPTTLKNLRSTPAEPTRR